MSRLCPDVSAQKSRLTTTQRILIITLSLGVVLSGVGLSTSAALRAKLGLAKASKPEIVQQPQAQQSVRLGSDPLRFLNAGKAARASSLAPPVAPTVTATKTDSLFADADSDSQADPGDTIKYTVNINASGQDATGVTFTDNVDPNTTFVPGSLTATPVAVNDSYSALGNVRISVAAPGVLGNDFTGLPSATITAPPSTSANGGNVTLNADGSFTYNPPAGFEGTDTFTYTLTNSQGSNNATVTINVSGMIWFINNTASCPCDGRLTNPFNSLASFQAVNNGAGNNPAANDNIFVYESPIDYVGPVTLLNGQKFIGQDATASLSSITGLTPPPESDPLPTMNSANATIVNITSATTSITVASGNTLTGFTGGNAGTDISGTGFGTLTISDVTLNGTGQALNLTSGNLAATFVSVSSTSSATTGISLTSVGGTLTIPTTTITNPTGSAITVNTSSGSLNFGNTNATGSGSTGVNLTANTGAISFGSLSISPAAGQRGLLATDNTNTITSTSGDISTTTGIPVQITRASSTTPLALSLTSVSSSGATNGIILTNTSGSFTVAGNGSTANSGGIITQSTGSANNADPNGKAVLLTNASNVTLRFMKVSVTTGNASAIVATDISGTNSIEKSLIDFNNSAPGVAATAYGLRVFNTNKNTTVNVDATTFQNKSDSSTAVSYSINGNSQVSVNVTDNNTADTFDSKYTGLFPSGIVMGCGDDVGSTAKCFFNVSNSKFINAPANGINDLEMLVQQSATLVPNISNNTFDKVGLASAVVGLINVNTLGSGRLGDNSNNALFSGNTITNSQSTSPTFAYTPGGNQGYLGMRFAIDGNAGVNDKVKILNNNIRAMARQGILISARTSRNDVNFLVDGNTVGTAAQPVSTSNRRGIEVETQTAASLKIQVSNNVSIASAGTSNTNSSLHFRAGTGGSDTGTLFATVTGNNITNSNAANTGGRFKAETVSVGSGNICLDLANNTLDAATKEFNLVHASTPPGVFNFRNGGGNVGTVTTSGTITNIVTGCSTPVLVKSFAPNSSGSSFAAVAAEESESAGGPSAAQIAWNPNPLVQSPEGSKNILQVLGGERADESSTPQLTQAELNANVLAAIQRLTDAGLSGTELANLQQLTFEVANLPDDQLASTDGNAVRVDVTAAGYGWFSDATPLEDSEFDVLVPDKERQATESSPAFGKIDLLTVVMRQLRMAAGEVSSEGAARWLTQGTLPAGTRRAPAFKLPDAAKAKSVPNAKQSATIAQRTEKRKDNVQQIAATNTPRNARVLRNHATRTPMSLADVMLNIGTLPAGESVTITFNATVNNPFTGSMPQVSNQGTVSGSNFGSVLTDDPAVGGTADPTVTPIDLPAVSVAVSPASVLEDGATNLVYTFTRTGSTASAMTVNFNVGGTASFTQPDYTQTGAATFTATSGTVVIPAGSSTAAVTIDPSADTTVEPDETVNLTVASGAGYTVGSPSSASGTITNDDTDVSVAVSPAAVAEDGATNLTYTFTRAGATANSLTVNFSVGGTATFGVSPNDYTETGATTFTSTTGSVTFAAGSTTAVVTVDPEADSVVEPDETVALTLTAGTGYNVASPSAATGTIINDDTDVSVAVSPAAVAEDGATNLVYTFTRNGVTSGALTVNFSVGGTATFGVSPNDYTETGATSFTSTTGTVTFAPGSSTAIVTVDPEADSVVEPDETVNLTVTAGAGYNVASPSSASGTIINDDTDVTIAVSPASVAEDGATNLVYTFTRTGVTAGSLTVNFSVGGSATFGAGNDYTETGAATFTGSSGSVTFGAGSSTATVTVNPEADSTVEPDETVDLTLTSGAGYNVGSPSSASGTITNDDTDVSLAVSPAAVAEDGATNLVYTFTRAGVTTNSLTVNFTVGGTATFGVSPNDYTETGATSFTPPTGTVTFAPGSSTATITVNPEADTTIEPDETVSLTLAAGAGYNVSSPSSATGTITNDDADVSVAVSPAAVAEDGATNLVYTFTRTGFTGGALTVNFSVGGTATFGVSPNDYTETGATTFTTTSGSVTFAPGSPTATVTVDPEADTTVEADETVIITLTAGASYNAVSPNSATGTILNDDTLVSVAVSPTTTAEGGAPLVYTFTRTGPTTSALSVNFSVGGSASFPADYSQGGATTFTPPTATVTFGAGSSTATVTVTPLTDCIVEGNETVDFTVQPGTGYGVGSPSAASGTITNTPDSGAPTITLIPNVNMTLWPPNHQYETVSVTDFVASASDNCDPTVNLNSVYILKITSDEVENGNGDGNTLNDIVIAGDCKSAQLRAERDGSADGRVYTITFKVKDATGNFSTATATVTVRKNANTPAVDSGTHYTVNSSCP